MMARAKATAGGLAHLRRAAMLAVATCALSACMVGPDFTQPTGPGVSGYVPGRLVTSSTADGKTQHLAQGRDIPGEWWRLFRSKALNTLVSRAIADNADLKAAQAALRGAQANVQAQRGAFFPQVSANYNPVRQKVSIDPLVPSTPGGFNQPYYTTQSAQLIVGFVPDVFGGIRRQVENLEAVTENQRFQLEATYLTLTSNLAVNAVQEATLRAQVDATKTLIKLSKEFLDLTKKSYNLGQLTQLDVATQEAALAQYEQALPPLEKQIAINRDQLIALTGHFPGEGADERFEFASMHLPTDLPLSLPSDIVKQRPDVRAAEANMHAASAAVGVSIANRLPQFNISGNVGGQSAILGSALSLANPYFFWTIAGNATQVLFDGFTLEQKQRAAEAGLDQAAAQYKSAVVVGMQNVADSLQALHYDTKTLNAAILGERAAKKALDLTKKQLELGQIASLQVLSAQQTYFTALLAVVQARGARYSDTVALYQSLGGGWWNRSDVPVDEQGHSLWDHLRITRTADSAK